MLRPEIYCICGSMRHFKHILSVAADQTLTHNNIILMPQHSGVKATREQRAQLEMLHLHKIDLSIGIIVVRLDGCIDDTTEREIAYAQSHDKSVQYYNIEEHTEQ